MFTEDYSYYYCCSCCSCCYFTPCEFLIPRLADGLSLVSKQQKSVSVSRTLRNILADLKNAVWMLLILSPISNSFSPLIKPLGTVPRASFTIGIIVTLMFHSLFSSLTRSNILFLFSFSLIFTFFFSFFFFFFFFLLLLLGLVFELESGDRFVSQNPGEFCGFYSLGRILVCANTICSYGQI